MLFFLDTEFTCWPGCLETDWGEPWQHREIVEVGVLKVDPITFEQLGHVRVLVKPKINPVLSDLFVELTGITNEEVEKEGISFSAALEKLNAFCGTARCHSFGDEQFIFNENHKINGTTRAQQSFSLVDIEPWYYNRFKQLGINITKTNSGRLETQLRGLPQQKEHDALSDIRSLAGAAQFMRDTHGWKPEDWDNL